MGIPLTIRVFFAAGLVMAGIAGFFLGKTVWLMSRAETVHGMVVGYDRQGGDLDENPIVQFRTKDGEDIRFVSLTSGIYYAGESVEIMYDPNDPANAQIRGVRGVFGWAGMCGLGIAFTVPYFFSVRTQQRVRWFQQNGLRVVAGDARVEVNPAAEMNGCNPYRIVCHWRNSATGKEQTFTSNDLWSDPTAYIRDKHIGVFIDPYNPERYWVDTSFLSNKDA